MKLARIGEPGSERPIILTPQNDRYFYEASKAGVTDFDKAFFGNGGMDALRRRVEAEAHGWQVHELTDDLRIGAPTDRPPNFICIGLNDRDHITEAKGENAAKVIQFVEEEGPEIFFKHTGCFGGPNDPIIIPPSSICTDYEVEIGAVIGQAGYRIPIDRVDEFIAGYVAVNDISERFDQTKRGDQWGKGKGHPSFGAVGPWLVTPDQVEPNNLRLWLKLNGMLKQDAPTSNMICLPRELVAYTSRFMNLLPGDIITMGTPKGVGLGQKPNPIYLREGDVVEMEVEGLGVRKQRVVAADSDWVV